MDQVSPLPPRVGGSVLRAAAGAATNSVDASVKGDKAWIDRGIDMSAGDKLRITATVTAISKIRLGSVLQLEMEDSGGGRCLFGAARIGL